MNSTAIYAIYRFLFQTVWKAESFVVKNQNIGAANGKWIEWWMAKKWRVCTISKMYEEEKTQRGRKTNSSIWQECGHHICCPGQANRFHTHIPYLVWIARNTRLRSMDFSDCFIVTTQIRVSNKCVSKKL